MASKKGCKGPGHRTKESKLGTTQRKTQLLGKELEANFFGGPFPPKYLLAVLPLRSGSKNEMIVRSNIAVGREQHEELYKMLFDDHVPGKWNVDDYNDILFL